MLNTISVDFVLRKRANIFRNFSIFNFVTVSYQVSCTVHPNHDDVKVTKH